MARQFFSGAWEISADYTGRTVARTNEEGDARFIEAAPVMEEAIDEALELIDFYGNLDQERDAEAVGKLRAALSKARGKE
jgi:hypothetical protein